MAAVASVDFLTVICSNDFVDFYYKTSVDGPIDGFDGLDMNYVNSLPATGTKGGVTNFPWCFIFASMLIFKYNAITVNTIQL